jgi:uncharacterized caspase-like protein
MLKQMFGSAFLLLASVIPALAADRVALVIGNGAYRNAVALPNPVRDAASIADLLRRLNFKVVEGEDLDKASLDAKLREFAELAEGAEVTFVFYAGHGMQVNGKNYLIPVDAKLANSSALDFETVDVDRILNYARAGQDRIAVVLLDACRDNPLSRRFARSFVASRSGSTGVGLASPDVTGGGLVIGFATAPGQVASDGAGMHSPFTAALLRELPAPGIEIQQALTRVKADVYSATKGSQEPWHNSNLRFEFYLNPAKVAKPSGDNAVSTPDEELWRSLAGSQDRAAIELFIRAYPASPHSEEAKQRLARLTVDAPTRTVSFDMQIRLEEKGKPTVNQKRATAKGSAPAIKIDKSGVSLYKEPYSIECGLNHIKSRSDYPKINGLNIQLQCFYSKESGRYVVDYTEAFFSNNLNNYRTRMETHQRLAFSIASGGCTLTDGDGTWHLFATWVGKRPKGRLGDAFVKGATVDRNADLSMTSGTCAVR